jgi:hypothetical protein
MDGIKSTLQKSLITDIKYCGTLYANPIELCTRSLDVRFVCAIENYNSKNQYLFFFNTGLFSFPEIFYFFSRCLGGLISCQIEHDGVGV